MTGVDYRSTSLHYNRGIAFNKQHSRAREMSQNLPIHMQNVNNRMAMNQRTFDALRSQRNIRFREDDHKPKTYPKTKDDKEVRRYQPAPQEFLDPSTTFNTRKDFWVDPKKVKQQKI